MEMKLAIHVLDTCGHMLHLIGIHVHSLLHDHAWPEVKVILNNSQQFPCRLLSSAISVNVDRQRLSNTNGIGYLQR